MALSLTSFQLFGRKITGVGSGIGALLQGPGSNYITPALKAPDEQISLWVNCFWLRRAAAKRELNQKLLSTPHPRFRVEFDDCLRTAIADDNLFKELKASMQCEQVNVNYSSITALVPFFRSTSAKIGFILDHVAVVSSQSKGRPGERMGAGASRKTSGQRTSKSSLFLPALIPLRCGGPARFWLAFAVEYENLPEAALTYWPGISHFLIKHG